MTTTHLLAENLRAYVPRVLVRTLAEDPDSGGTPWVRRFPAAMLATDVSGFTALTERMVARGPDGVEELTRVLNRFFSRLIDEVEAHGGDVVRFAGDAILVLWPASDDDGDIGRTIARAAQCGLAVQATLGDASLTDYGVQDEGRLYVRVGVGAGEAAVFHLGGESGRWEIFIGGAATRQAGVAVGEAAAGQVVLSSEARALLPSADGEQLESGSLRLVRLDTPSRPRPAAPEPPVPASLLRAYVSAAIHDRLAAGHTEWLAELRQVTTVFINLAGLGPSTSLERAQEAAVVVQRVLDRYEGTLARLGTDDKGPTVLAAFGLPPRVHEDDAARGVRAALELQAGLAAIGQPCSIGVTTARVFCGAIGGERRCEYTMMGNAVNLSARLMQAAGDGILCDAATRAAAAARVAFEDPPPIRVKGRTEPVAVFRPLVEHHQADERPRTAMVGREAERQLLAERLDAVMAGQGSVILLEGEPGLGKSRLLEDLFDRAREGGVGVIASAAEAVEQSTAYYAWRPVFAALLGLDDMPSDPAIRRALVVERVPADVARLAPLLSAVLPLEIPDDELTAQMTGRARADSTIDLLVRVFSQAVAAPGGPRLLVLDDAHWLDSASWALARAIAERVPGLLLVLATRPIAEPVPPDYRRLVDAPGSLRLTLDALAPEEALALVSQRLGVSRLPEAVGRLITERAHGNPFFAEELAHALREAGHIVVRDGICTVPPQVDLRVLAVPDTVQGVVASRIDRLGAPEQLTIKVASAVGRVFAVDLLRDVYPVESDRGALPGHLGTLERFDLTPIETPEPDLAYRFKHAITQDVAYGLMLYAQRRQLHRAVAEWLEARFGADPESYLPLLAYHWSRAEVPAKAIEYLDRAGEQALHNGAYQEASRFFADADALDQAGPTERVARRARLLGEAFCGLGDLEAGRLHLERSLALRGWPMPSGAASRAAVLTTELARQFVHRLRWRADVRSVTPGAEAALEAARAYERLGTIYYYRIETVPLVISSLRVVSLAARAGPCPELARGYANLCVAFGVVPLPKIADWYERAARATAEQVQDANSVAYLNMCCGTYRAGVGQWREAIGSTEEAIDLFDRLGERRHLGMSWFALAWMNFNQGRFEASRECWRRTLEIGRQSGDAQLQVVATNGQGYCWAAQGQYDEAWRWVEATAALPGRHDSRIEEIWDQSLAASTALHRGDVENARRAADRTAELIGQSRQITNGGLLEGYAGPVEVYLGLWRDQPTDRVLAAAAKRSLAALHRFAGIFPLGRPRAWLWQGVYEWQRGRQGRARQAWVRSLAEAEKVTMPAEIARAHHMIGAHAPVGDPSRREHLERAIAMFDDLGMAADLAAARAALAQ